MKRFWEKVKKTDTCWEWQAGKNNWGYGMFWMDGKMHLAHRIAYGDVPEGKCLLHKCDNRKCVNPDHLFVGTRTDNHNDMVAKGRQRFSQRKYDHDEIRAYIRQGVKRRDIAAFLGCDIGTVRYATSTI